MTKRRPRATSPESFRTLVEQIKDHAIFMIDASGKILTWNDGARRITGYASDDVVGKSFSLLYTEPDATSGKPEYDLRVAEAEGRFEEDGWRVRRDGVPFWANATVTTLRDDNGAMLGYGNVMRDLTRRHDIEEALRRSHARYRQLVDNVREHAILLLDAKGRIATWSGAAQKVFGHAAVSVVGKKLDVLYTEEDVINERAALDLATALERGGLEEDAWRVRADGSRFWANVVLAPIRDGGDGAGFTLVVRDMTERREIERALGDALRARDDFLSLAAHELKTPLNSMGLHLRIAERALRDSKEPLADELRSAVVTCDRNVRKLSSIVDELRDTARIRGGRLKLNREQIDLCRLAREVVDSFIEENGAKIRFSGDEPVIGNWDEARLDQVITNLLSNAVAYGDGKPVDVAVERDGARPVGLLRVEDRGVGIAPEVRATMFERFTRGPSSPGMPSGLGLGLYVVHKIVSQHGGTIRVQSELGRGSRFEVELPLDQREDSHYESGGDA